MKNSPGPGSYNTKPITGKEGVKHSFGARRPASAKNSNLYNPGPGTYTIDTKSNAGSVYKFGTEKKEYSDRHRTPGPGTYSPSDKFSKESAPGWR